MRRRQAILIRPYDVPHILCLRIEPDGGQVAEKLMPAADRELPKLTDVKIALRTRGRGQVSYR